MNINYLSELGNLCRTLEGQQEPKFDDYHSLIMEDKINSTESISRLQELLNAYLNIAYGKSTETVVDEEAQGFFEKVWLVIKKIIAVAIDLIYKGLNYLTKFVLLILKQVDKIIFAPKFDINELDSKKHLIPRTLQVSIKNYHPEFVTRFNKLVDKLRTLDIEKSLSSIVNYGIRIREMELFDKYNKQNLQNNIKQFYDTFFKDVTFGSLKTAFDFLIVSKDAVTKPSREINVKQELSYRFYNTIDLNYLEAPYEMKFNVYDLVHNTEMMSLIENDIFFDNLYYIKYFYHRVYPKMVAVREILSFIDKKFEKLVGPRVKKSAALYNITIGDPILKILGNLVTLFCQTATKFFQNTKTIIIYTAEIGFDYKKDTAKVIQALNKIIYEI